MNLPQDAQRVVDYIERARVPLADSAALGGPHMGALVANAVLQRQLKFRSVVAPRLRRIQETWPQARTVTGLRQVLDDVGGREFLNWSDVNRAQQVRDLVDVFLAEGIDTQADLYEALHPDKGRREGLRRRLRAVKYVGPKTLDYIDMLAGLEAVAVDSRLRDFADAAGVRGTYDHLHAVYEKAADLLGISIGRMDRTAWNWADRERAE